MPITLLTGPANAGKAGVVLQTWGAHRARGQQPFLVVPTRADVERFRPDLGDGQVERFEGLLAEIVRRAGDGGRPLSRIVRERALTAVLRQTAGEHPTRGVVRSLMVLIEELEVDRVTPARLHAALGAWLAADPAAPTHTGTLGELYRRYCRELERLRPAGVSPERLATRALDELRRAPALWGGTPLLLYGFDDFTRLQLDAIETLGVPVAAPVTVSLTYEPGRTAFASRGDTFQRLLPLAAEHLSLPPRAEHYAPLARAALHHLERHIFEPSIAPAPVPAGQALRLLQGGDERAELELVAAAITDLLQRGIPPAEIAVAHRSPATVAELLSEVFRAHNIPFALPRRLPLPHTATGRALLGLLQAAFPQDQEAELADLLVWLRAPGVLHHAELADQLEARARRAGARSVAQARALWQSGQSPFATLDQLQEAAARSPTALIDCAAAELSRLGFAALVGASADSASSTDPVVSAHTTALANVSAAQQPPSIAERHEAHALQTAQEALEQLRVLARSTPALAPDAHELISVLHGLELVVGGESAGASAVAVLDPLALRARRVRALLLCGLQEGVFPAPARPEPYLSEQDRRGLAQAAGLRLGRPWDALAGERYLLYAAVSRPQELLVLSWHAATGDGLPSARSLFVDDICDLFALADPAFPDSPTPGATGTIAPLETGTIAPLAPRATVPAAPRPIAPLRDPRVLAELREQRLWSASGLQAWAGCPVQWFVERLLGARELQPEAEPLARGGLAHAALRQTFERLRDETGSARLCARRLPRARELLRAALDQLAEEYPLSTFPERVPGMRRRLQADLERYLKYAAGCAERAGAGHQLDLAEIGQTSQLEPTHLELAFGFPAEKSESSVAGPPGGLPPLDLGDGALVRGYIDRVDLAPGGEAVVYDYKSSAPAPPDRWLGERNFQIALYMRAVEQQLGARVVGGFYQPLSGRDLRARGVLAEGEGVALECVRGDARPPNDVRELVDGIVAAAREAAEQARAGRLQARPDTCGFAGAGCMYPSICRCDR